MDNFPQVPPGFRFHPTDEELVDYYLRKKIASRRIDLDVIRDIDLYRIEPWDLQELCKIGTEEQNEWYFFSHKDKKYPTGTRTNRATKVGFWKATGRDKAIYSKHSLIGMRKTLVYYKGRAPNGQKSDWIMHEYRLETNENGNPQEEGWVVCRVFKKRMTAMRKMGEHESPRNWYDEQDSMMSDFDSPSQTILSQPYASHYPQFSCKKELELHYNSPNTPHDLFFHLPQLESPNTAQPSNASGSCISVGIYGLDRGNIRREEILQQSMNEQNANFNYNSNKIEEAVQVDQLTDWRVLDRFVASQLSHEDASKEENNYSNSDNSFQVGADEVNLNMLLNNSISNCHIDLWK
ncbi:hypothetical protein NMG60_11030333 [Bertholletia excelsa]